MTVHYFSTSTQCVRDWSGILLERSGKRYSGKPDGDSRNALKKSTDNRQRSTDFVHNKLGTYRLRLLN